MSSTRTFSDVTAELLSRMKEFGRAKYGIVYDPPEGPVSTATNATPVHCGSRAGKTVFANAPAAMASTATGAEKPTRSDAHPER